MTFVVPFDGTDLSEAALVRAYEFGEVLDERIVALTVIPKGNESYARERGWLDADESFDRGSIVRTLHEHVASLVPEADFRHAVVDRYAPASTIANRLCKMAAEEEASMLFVGSDNAGRIVVSVGSVGGSVSGKADYDLVIVRNRKPSAVKRLRKRSPHRRKKSDFYLSG